MDERVETREGSEGNWMVHSSCSSESSEGQTSSTSGCCSSSHCRARNNLRRVDHVCFASENPQQTPDSEGASDLVSIELHELSG